MPNPMPKSPYKFPAYIYGPRHGRAYLDVGSPYLDPQAAFGNNINELMDTTAEGPSEPLQIEDYAATNAAPRSFEGRKFGLVDMPEAPVADWRKALLPAETTSATPTDETTQAELPTALGSSYDTLEDRWRKFPKMKDPAKIPWWQRGLAGAAGFGAGWSNAASRTRRPIDIAAMQGNILQPEYGEKLAAWRSSLAPAEAEAQIEGMRQQAALKAEQIRAQAQARLENAARWKERNIPIDDPEMANFFHKPVGTPIDREVYRAYIQKKLAQTPQKGAVKQMSPMEASAARSLGLDPANMDSWDATAAQNFFNLVRKQTPAGKTNAIDLALASVGVQPGQVPTPQQAAAALQRYKPPKAARDPNAPKPFTQAQKDSIGNAKDTELRQLMNKTQEILRNPSATDEQKQRAMEDEAYQADAIQRQYETRVEQHVGEAQPHFDMYTWMKNHRQQIEGGRQPSPAITEQEARKRAAAGGATPAQIDELIRKGRAQGKIR
jgi:hypothetical protein